MSCVAETKGQQPEERQRDLEKMRRGNRQRDGGQRRAG